MKYRIDKTSVFDKDVKRANKRNYDITLLNAIINKLANGEVLEVKYKDHSLKGDYKGYRECHITPDWLLIYRIYEDVLILTLFRTGSHSDLFE